MKYKVGDSVLVYSELDSKVIQVIIHWVRGPSSSPLDNYDYSGYVLQDGAQISFNEHAIVGPARPIKRIDPIMMTDYKQKLYELIT